MLYIFHGPNDFARNEKIAELCATVGDSSLIDLNVTSLEGRELTLGEIRNYTDAMPFMASKRVIIVYGYVGQLRSQSDEMHHLSEYLRYLPGTTDLILIEDEPLRANHPLLKVTKEIHAVVLNFANLDKNALHSWIIQRAKAHGATIEPSAAELLGRLVGADLRTLNSEIQKLFLYVGGHRPIERADVELLVPYTEEAENFGLANAIGHRNARRAYDQMRKMLDEGKHPLSILGSIAAQVRGLLEVKDLAARGLSPLEIAKLKGWRSDYAAKMRLKEAANFSMAQLEGILELLLEIDVDIKTGRVDSPLALDILVARLCGEKVNSLVS